MITISEFTGHTEFSMLLIGYSQLSASAKAISINRLKELKSDSTMLLGADQGGEIWDVSLIVQEIPTGNMLTRM